MAVPLSQAARRHPAARRRGVRGDRPAGRLEDPRRAGRAGRLAVDRAYELSELERLGLLTHPHTSAGRVPTEAGYRLYVDHLLSAPEPRPAVFTLDLSARPGRGRGGPAADDGDAFAGDAAARCRLGASPRGCLRPPRRGAPAAAEHRHGGRDHVHRRCLQAPLHLRRAGRPGPRRSGRPSTSTSGSQGVRIGSRAARLAFDEPGLGARERAFLIVIRAAFDQSPDEERRLYLRRYRRTARRDADRGDRRVSKPARGAREAGCAARRARSAARPAAGPFARVGEELEQPGLRDLALVGATYGLAHQTLGAVSLLGPLRMDYEKALRTVRGAANELSRFVEEVYGDD